MRSVDRTPPTIDPHRPAVEPWPAVLHIGIQRQPVPVYVWDDYSATWDDTLGRYLWDDRDDFPYERMDLWCHFHGLTVTAGNPDSEGVFESAHCEMTLDNRDGALSQYDDQGRLVDWQPGSPLDIWAVYGGEAFWIFAGRISVWREQSDGTLEVEAVDGFSELNRFLAEWTPGVTGQTPGARMTSVCTRVGFRGRTRFAGGTVTCLTEVTGESALEHMQRVARSDGGALFGDADGTVVYADRSMLTSGRDDQTTIRLLSDNYCDGGALIVWDAVQTTTDDEIVNAVTLANIADLSVSAENVASSTRYGPVGWPSDRTDDLWETAPQGQALADHIVAQRGVHRLALEEVSLYLHDRRVDLWPAGLDLRIGDLVDWQHTQPTTTGPGLMTLTLPVTTVVHDITPETWVTTLSTARAVDWRPMGAWDETTWAWDDADPLNVWS